MAEHLKGVDALGHMVTTSVSHAPEHADLFDVRGIDIAQEHAYLPRWVLAADATQLDEVAMVAEAVSRPRIGKPLMLAEFGYGPERSLGPADGPTPETPRRNVQDAEGVLLHNALWSSLVCTGNSTAMVWWWDDYVERHGLWDRFRGPAAFAAELAQAPAPAKPLAEDGRSALRLLGTRTDSSAAVWIHERLSTALTHLEGKFEPPVRKDVRVSIPSMEAGRYRLRWFDTWGKGPPVEQTVRHAGGGLEFTVPEFKRDIAVIVVRIGPATR
jgi:hypothetical protein